jgi:hypothetical protein
VDSLRTKGFVREAMLSGSRVAKFKHQAREALGVETPALVILVELMLRGPQSVGEIRQNASRMHPLDSTEAVKAVLDELAARPEPLVKEYPPPPGGRARVYRQLLAPTAHAEPVAGVYHAHEPGHHDPETGRGPAVAPAAAAAPGVDPSRLEALEAEVARLRTAVQTLAAALGVAV